MAHYVFVSGPYSKGDTIVNIQQAIEAADTLLDCGFVPFCPHLTAFWHLISPHDYEEWLAYDQEWLKRCDAVVRLPGESGGADKEVALAKELGIPIFEGLDAIPNFVHWAKGLPVYEKGISASPWEGYSGHPGFYELLEKMAQIHSAKNSDYARGKPLGNLRASEAFGVSAPLGTLVRMSDKVARIQTLMAKRIKGEGPAVTNESLLDSLLDLSVYSLLMILLLKEDDAAKV